ncbi:12465_t:CDS:1 [Gigaspora margarita]|uniref:12465_t:CDS:1 n=1 Tax=Gigaspora margarita TaxID=4874 RepID=A0ABN7USJ7_GIGMA|nr:12465_t:CDS:1 [Gigaspora margarita]
MCYMDNKILHCSNDDIDFTLPFNKCFADNSSVIGYINKGNLYESNEFINGLTTLSIIRNIDDVFESSNFEYWPNFASKNVEDTLLKSGKFEYQSNFASVIGNIEDNVFENSDLKYQFNLVSVIGNVENDAFESNDLEYQFNFTSVIENVEDNICKSNLKNESKDSSLKEIYTEQTFSTLELLEKCLKCYSTKMGFETKIV